MNKFKLPTIKEAVRKYKLKLSGKKSELIERLINHFNLTTKAIKIKDLPADRDKTDALYSANSFLAFEVSTMKSYCFFLDSLKIGLILEPNSLLMISINSKLLGASGPPML